MSKLRDKLAASWGDDQHANPLRAQHDLPAQLGPCVSFGSDVISRVERFGRMRITDPIA